MLRYLINILFVIWLGLSHCVIASATQVYAALLNLMPGSNRKALIKVDTGTDLYVLHDYLPSLSEFSHVEPLDLPRERTVFNAPKKV